MSVSMQASNSLDHVEDIHRPGEQVTLSDGHIGHILCKTLIVPKGVRAEVSVAAEEIYVHGDVIGSFTGGLATIAKSGSFEGRIRAHRINLAGNIEGLAHTKLLVCRSGSRLEGAVISDQVERQPGSIFMAEVAIGEGFASDRKLVRDVENRLFSKKDSPVTRSSAVPDQSFQSPERVDPEPDNSSVIPFLVR